MSPVLRGLIPTQRDALARGGFFSSVLTGGFRSAQDEQVAQWKGSAHSILKLLFCKWKTKAKTVYRGCLLPTLQPTSFANIHANLPLDRKECALPPALLMMLLEENICFPDMAVHAYNPSTWESESGGLLQVPDQLGLQSQKPTHINNKREEMNMLFLNRKAKSASRLFLQNVLMWFGKTHLHNCNTDAGFILKSQYSLLQIQFCITWKLLSLIILTKLMFTKLQEVIYNA